MFPDNGKHKWHCIILFLEGEGGKGLHENLSWLSLPADVNFNPNLLHSSRLSKLSNLDLLNLNESANGLKS